MRKKKLYSVALVAELTNGQTITNTTAVWGYEDHDARLAAFHQCQLKFLGVGYSNHQVTLTKIDLTSLNLDEFET